MKIQRPRRLGRSLAVLAIVVLISATVRAVWYRRPEKPIAHEAVRHPTARAFAQEECHGVLQDVWSAAKFAPECA